MIGTDDNQLLFKIFVQYNQKMSHPHEEISCPVTLALPASLPEVRISYQIILLYCQPQLILPQTSSVQAMSLIRLGYRHLFQ